MMPMPYFRASLISDVTVYPAGIRSDLTIGSDSCFT
jgi:hypothetical protein